MFFARVIFFVDLVVLEEPVDVAGGVVVPVVFVAPSRPTPLP